MKKLSHFFKSIYLFFFYLTPKGKIEKLFQDSEAALTNHFFDLGLKELEAEQAKKKVKKACINYAEKVIKKKRFSNFHLGMITAKKHEKGLADTNTVLDPTTLKFKDA